MADRHPGRVVAAPGPDQPVDILGQHGLKHLQAGPHGQGQQPFAGGAGRFGHGDGHSLGQVQLGVVGRGGALGILRHGGPLLVELLGGCPTPTTRQASGGDRHLNFYGNRDNLGDSSGRAQPKAGEASRRRQQLGHLQPGTARGQHQRAPDGPDLNYWLDGKDNFPVDRQVGDQILEAFPAIVENARGSRAFLARAVQYLAGEAGIRQFLDIGTGLPTANNAHQVAQAVAPECRIVYVDNDPIVLTHARALLTSTPQGATAYLDADLRDPDTILPPAARTLDFSQPVAIMLMGILGHIAEDEKAQSIVKRLVGGVGSGSYLTMNDGTDTSQEVVEAARIWNQSANPTYHLRSPDRIARFFDGLELVEPGVVSPPRWRPEPSGSGPPAEIDSACGVGRKP